MAKVLAKSAKAGFEEKNDLLVEAFPMQSGNGITIELQSPVKNQYGKHIEEVIKETAENKGFSDIRFVISDKGAWDYTIKARVTAALERGMKL